MLTALEQKSTQIIVLRLLDLVRAAIEINFSGAQDDEVGGRGGLTRIAILRTRHHAPRLPIKAIVRQAKRVLQTMRGQHGGYALRVAQAKDQRDDRLGSD